MNKIVIRCPKCKKKMKIVNRAAKYKCPNCQEVYKYTEIKKITNYPIRVAFGFVNTIKDIFIGIKTKYTMAKNSAKYLRQVKKNIKSDANWSNVHKEKNRMKEANRASKKSFFSKYKK